MTNIHSIQEQRERQQNSIDMEEALLDAASDWVAKLDRGLSQPEKKLLRSWLTATPENMQVLLEVAHLWDKMDELERLADLFPQSPTIDKTNRMKIWTGALVASLMLVVTSAVYLNSIEGGNFFEQQTGLAENRNQIIQTNIGESNTVYLSDGSKIILNTNTLAEILFTPAERIIKLERGEIHIDVAHDKTRPLSVVVGGKIIQAIGTAFNIEVRSDSIELIVTDGKVLVAPVQEKLLLNDIDRTTIKLPRSSVAISKGEKINLAVAGKTDEGKIKDEIKNKVIKVAPIEIAASLSWRTGNLIFRGESLTNAMAEISRYSEIKFELDDDTDLKKIRVAGMFRTGDIDGLLSVLEQNFNIQHQRINERKIFLKLPKLN